jgi:hypothetical protein
MLFGTLTAFGANTLGGQDHDGRYFTSPRVSERAILSTRSLTRVVRQSSSREEDDWWRALIFHYATSPSRSENQKLNEQVTLEID